jgi:hypothetical protein
VLGVFQEKATLDSTLMPEVEENVKAGYCLQQLHILRTMPTGYLIIRPPRVFFTSTRKLGTSGKRNQPILCSTSCALQEWRNRGCHSCPAIHTTLAAEDAGQRSRTANLRHGCLGMELNHAT